MNLLLWARAQWDRVGGWILIAAGAIAIILGWNGVSREGLTAQQIPYVVSGGIGGLFLLGIGATLLLSADLRDEWRKLDAIETVLTHADAQHDATAVATDTSDEVADDPFALSDVSVGTAARNGQAPAKKATARKPVATRRAVSPERK